MTFARSGDLHRKIRLDRIPKTGSSAQITQAYSAIKTVVARAGQPVLLFAPTRRWNVKGPNSVDAISLFTTLAALQVIVGNQNTALYPRANLFPPNAANVNYTRFQALYNDQVSFCSLLCLPRAFD